MAQLSTLGVIVTRFDFMGKKNKRRRSQAKQPARQTPLQAPPRRGISRVVGALSPTGWFWASVSLLLAIVGSYYLLRPQIEVEPDAAINPAQPMTTPFRITNRSVLPIYGVRKWCGIKKLESDQSAMQRVSYSNLGFIDETEPTIPRLDSGESTSVFIHAEHFPVSIAGQPIVNGDIDVVVDYVTAILKIHREQIFRFETRKDVNNEVRWYHKASSE